MYKVVHMYDYEIPPYVGYTDVEKETLCVFPTKEEAEEYCKRYGKRKMYEKAFDSPLTFGYLCVEKFEMPKIGDLNSPPDLEYFEERREDYFEMYPERKPYEEDFDFENDEYEYGCDFDYGITRCRICDKIISEGKSYCEEHEKKMKKFTRVNWRR